MAADGFEVAARGRTEVNLSRVARVHLKVSSEAIVLTTKLSRASGGRKQRGKGKG